MSSDDLIASVPTGLWIGGEERPGSSTFDVLNPATDEVITSVADATPADAHRRPGRRGRGASRMGGTPARERGEILRSVFETLTARSEDLATLMTLEMARWSPRAAAR
jgi:succinate-semialdehyde dehydrogenase/glutarate-semialdehyde dehydrogenase